MIRYTIFILIVMGSAATAIAAMVPGEIKATGHNVTVIEKNQAFPVLGPVTVEPCGTEDCSEV